MAKKLRILFVCSEATPLAKTGGMADVCGALPTYLAKNDHEVDVVLPFYESIDMPDAQTDIVLPELAIHMAGQTVDGKVTKLKFDSPWNALLVQQDGYFNRKGLYTDPDSGQDYPDNAARFAFFAKAVVEIVRQAKPGYDIVHAHDWQAALVVAYLRKWGATDAKLAKPGTLFTIHNLGYQGIFPPDAGAFFDLPDAFHPDDMEFYGKWNLLKGAIQNADYISTVSEKYAKEIQTQELGFGLGDRLAARADHLEGITHGVDDTTWNPQTDPFIVANYSAKNLKGKEKCKADLLKTFGLPAEWGKKPLIGFIGRLIEQKGLELISAIADDLVAHGYLLIILGMGTKKYESEMLDLAHRFPEAVAVRIAFDEKLAHKIEAGADLLLMPSIYEPCGLTQMYSHKYGTLPIVRATGGLDDTVRGWSKGTRSADGFKFTDPNPESLLKVLADAAELFEDKKKWEKLVLNAMEVDHSWDKAVRKYERVYSKIINAKKAKAKAAKAEATPAPATESDAQ